MILAGILAALYAISRIRQRNRAAKAEATAVAILEQDAMDLLGEANKLTERSQAAHDKADIRKEQALKALDRLANADPSTAHLISGWNSDRIAKSE